MDASIHPTVSSAVSFREVTARTVREICQLKTTVAQEHFVAPNAASIAQAYFNKLAWFRAIYADETPVGFVMLEDNPDKASYYLWRFMMAAPYQRMGFGSRAIQLLIEHVRTRPNATALRLSCVPGEGSPQPFYERLGFRPTGDMDEGEIVMSIKL